MNLKRTIIANHREGLLLAQCILNHLYSELTGFYGMKAFLGHPNSLMNLPPFEKTKLFSGDGFINNYFNYSSNDLYNNYICNYIGKWVYIAQK
jgi:hypothetical protein